MQYNIYLFYINYNNNVIKYIVSYYIAHKYSYISICLILTSNEVKYSQIYCLRHLHIHINTYRIFLFVSPKVKLHVKNLGSNAVKKIGLK